jgi:hypothetical protein
MLLLFINFDYINLVAVAVKEPTVDGKFDNLAYNADEACPPTD